MSSLYLEHFGLSEAPFGITPNGRFFFSGQARGATLDGLQHAVLDEDGIIVVIGEVGSGKTMLCRMLAERLQGAAVDLVYLANPSFGPREILDSLIADWGLDVPVGQPAVLSIQAALMARHEQGRRVVVLIDEAQAMQPDSLEEIKLLSNLETSQRKLMQIVLFGQPELNELLAQPRLRQVRDRVVHRFELQPLTESDSIAYIDHRLRRAGWRGARLFDQRALKSLVAAAAGRIRAIHLLADKALLAAYAEGTYEILPAHVKRAQTDLMSGGDINSRMLGSKNMPRGLLWGLVIGVFALAMGIGVGLLVGRKSSTSDVPIAQTTAPRPSAPVSQTSGNTSSTNSTNSTNATSAAPTTLSKPVISTPNALTSPELTPTSTASDPPPKASSSAEKAPMAERYAELPDPLRQQVEKSRAFLDDAQLQGWTIQVGIAKDVTALKTLLHHAKDVPPVWVHDRFYSKTNTVTGHTGLGAVWAVYVGRYESRSQAYEAMRDLPTGLKNAKPLIRTFGGIRSEPYPERPPV